MLVSSRPKQKLQNFDQVLGVLNCGIWLRDKAWSQLGTSGTGNHFVEFGALSVDLDQARVLGLEPGEYLALLSHSGSRGAGAQVCEFYSRRAMALHEQLPKELKQLAWLSLADADGVEYWAAMSLMGLYAAANHALIHRHIARKLGIARRGPSDEPQEGVTVFHLERDQEVAVRARR
jgi:RNA-splicing ligase RtcB